MPQEPPLPKQFMTPNSGLEDDVLIFLLSEDVGGAGRLIVFLIATMPSLCFVFLVLRCIISLFVVFDLRHGVSVVSQYCDWVSVPSSTGKTLLCPARPIPS